jgi:hypothetical protein
VAWAPSGENILIQEGWYKLRVINSIDGSSSDIVKTTKAFTGYAWSPDNRSVAYTESWDNDHADNQKNIRVISLNGGEVISIPVELRNDPKEGMQLFDWFKFLDFKVGKKYTINILAKDLTLRESPSRKGKIMRSLNPNETVLLVDGPVNADYYTWWKVKVGDVEGWAQGIKYWFDAAK